MTTLAADSPRVYEKGEINEFGVIAGDIIYEGAAVGDNASGYARPLQAGDPFRGFAESNADNSAVGAAAGDVNVRTLMKGRIKLSISAAAITDVGKPVYASDDNTFTFTQSTNTFIGRAVRFESTGVMLVEFAAKGGSGNVTELTDSSTGTANDTVVEVPDLSTSDTYTDAALNTNFNLINDNFADLTAKVNALLRMAE